MAKHADTEIRLALFGESAAGKTTLLASYFGNQQRHAFEERHGYRLEAEDTSDGNELLSRYYGMEQGRFPRGTDAFREHRFALLLKLPDRHERVFRVTWYDYPGGWWERTPSDAGEREARREALEKLAGSHVGILLIDGDKYVREGIAYVRNLLDRFKNEVGRIAPLPAADALPRQWILAVSKADLLPPGTTAETVYRDLTEHARDQLDGLASTLPSPRPHAEAPRAATFGRNVLLLAAVRGDGAQVMDAHRYIGLTLLAPLALTAILRTFRDAAGSGDQYGWLRTLLEKLRSFVNLVDQLDDLLPRKYQALTHLLRLLDTEEALDKGAAYFAKKQQAAAQRGRAFEAAVYALQRELASDEARGVYHEAPEPPSEEAHDEAHEVEG